MPTNLVYYTTDLNTRERLVLSATIKAAGGNGFDFTFGDEVVAECAATLTAQQVGGYLAALQTKGYLYIHSADDLRVNGRLLGTSQITFEGALGEAIDNPDKGGDWLLAIDAE